MSEHLEPSAPAGIAAQVTAADPSHSAWVSANAGTGKTRVLIDRISRLLLAGTKPEKILCLTFTKAAAAEMANRLDSRLGRWAADDEDELRTALSSLLGRDADETEIARARRLFAETMEAPEGLRIRTIHSFCESLLARFPLEARVAPHFQVIDERRAAELRHECRDLLLRRSLNRKFADLGAAVARLSGLVDEAGFAGVMAELDHNRRQLSTLVDAHGGKDGVIEAGRRALGLAPAETQEACIALACAEDRIPVDDLVRAAEVLAEGSPTDRQRAEVLKAWIGASTKERPERFVDTYLPIFVTQKMEARAPTGLMTKKLSERHPAELEIMVAEQTRLLAVHARLKAIATAENTTALLTIGIMLLQAYRDLKAERALLDYDDLITKAGELLDSGGGVSWVHFKLDGGIDHILVDEAQDTSGEQWRIISALADDFFAGAGREVERPRTIFAVGDEKQSIYSFQGADPAHFSDLEESFGARVTDAEQHWRPVQLAHSWRSVPAVLRAVDAVFAQAEAADGLSWRGRRFDHPTHRMGQAGLVELWPMTAPLDVAEPDPWDAPLDQLGSDDPQRRLAAKIADTVRDWINDGEELESLGRPIGPGDVMVLVRTRGAFSEEMVRALKDRGIDVAGRDRLVLTDHLAVMDLVALGRFALLPDDDMNTAIVLKGPMVGLNDDQLFDVAHGRTGTLWRALGDARSGNPVFADAHERLGHVLARADQNPPFEFFSEVLERGGRRSLLAHLGPEAEDPLDEFLNLALSYERDHVPSLEGFLHWLEIGETEIKRDLEQAEDQVRVMTVHGAKGLQSPIVFLVDNGMLPARQLDDRLRWNAGEGDGEAGFVLWPAFKENEVDLTAALADNARLETEREYRRLLYVAMTRAEDRLYVAGWRGEREPAAECWHRLVDTGLRSLPDTVELSGDGILRLTSAQTAPVPSRQARLPLTGGQSELPDWTGRPAPPEPVPTKPLSPSLSDEEPPVVSPLAADGERFKRGRIIHALLQYLPDVDAAARRAAAAAYLAEPVHDLSEAARSEILAEVLAVLNHPDHGELFGPHGQAEVPIVGDIGGAEPLVISGQVDRLLVRPDAVTVVDFKTNRPPPREEEDVPEVYLRQMAVYRAALARIYPDREINAVILWTDGPRLMRLSEAQLDAHAP